ncbi:MAG: hypothetical protein HGGPFJEG_02472 [Ignavibacteria bacterium]|nr:hypothetical protein [Ignavibacteria bacterium]
MKAKKREIFFLKYLPLSIVYVIIIVLSFQMINRSGNNDFTSYVLSSKALLKHTNPYETGSPFPYIYPLTLAFILLPFSYFPPTYLQIAWFFLTFSSSIKYLNLFSSFRKKKLINQYTGLA